MSKLKLTEVEYCFTLDKQGSCYIVNFNYFIKSTGMVIGSTTDVIDNNLTELNHRLAIVTHAYTNKCCVVGDYNRSIDAQNKQSNNVLTWDTSKPIKIEV